MYLMIQNRGVVDPLALTCIGASGTRTCGTDDSIGEFGSGSKLSIALLLREGIGLFIYPGNLCMEFTLKMQQISGRMEYIPCVTYSGTGADGKQKSGTKETGFCIGWGTKDWGSPDMALREYVSNAIDGAIASGGTYKDIVIEVVEKPRAKRDHTSVFVEYTPAIQKAHKKLAKMFLHIGNPELLEKRILPKGDANPDETLVYKKGVLVAALKIPSVFNYNLGAELKLDESRNASLWDVTYALTQAMRFISVEQMKTLFKEVQGDAGALIENQLNSVLVSAAMASRKEEVKSAWYDVATEKGVITPACQVTADFVARKGYIPITFASNVWPKILTSAGCLSSSQILNKQESKGRKTSEPTRAMEKAVDWAMNLFRTFSMDEGRDLPPIKGFMPIMSGEAQQWGEYDPETKTIYLHEELAGTQLRKVALEEVAHHVTGAGDNSRDLQDFLFRLITKVAE